MIALKIFKLRGPVRHEHPLDAAASRPAGALSYWMNMWAMTIQSA